MPHEDLEGKAIVQLDNQSNINNFFEILDREDIDVIQINSLTYRIDLRDIPVGMEDIVLNNIKKLGVNHESHS